MTSLSPDEMSLQCAAKCANLLSAVEKLCNLLRARAPSDRTLEALLWCQHRAQELRAQAEALALHEEATLQAEEAEEAAGAAQASSPPAPRPQPTQAVEAAGAAQASSTPVPRPRPTQAEEAAGPAEAHGQGRKRPRPPNRPPPSWLRHHERSQVEPAPWLHGSPPWHLLERGPRRRH